MISQLDAIHSDLQRRARSGFGGALTVERNGVCILEAGYGWADRARSRPFTPETIAQIGSLTKQFTAAAVVDLALQGELDISDRLSRFFPDIPQPARDITLHRLLTHTAGLPEDCGADFDPLTRSDLIERCLHQVASPPGTNYAYSNLGYSALAAVIEVIAGTDLEDHLRRRFFEPLRMADTGYLFGHSAGYEARLRPRMALGYEGQAIRAPISDALRTLAPRDWHLRGNGGVQASGVDMVKWYRALAGGPVITDRMRQMLLTPYAWPDPTRQELGYGYGWFVRRDRQGNLVQVSHSGSDGVFYAAFVWRPQDRSFFYLVTNTGRATGAGIASSVLQALKSPELRNQD